MMYPKPTKATKDPAYLAEVRKLPCIICQEWGMRQLSATTAHHVCHDRFSGRKTDDRMAIPLCDGHHQGLRDRSKLAIHLEKARWRATYGPDHGFSARIQSIIKGDVTR